MCFLFRFLKDIYFTIYKAFIYETLNNFFIYVGIKRLK